MLKSSGTFSLLDLKGGHASRVLPVGLKGETTFRDRRSCLWLFHPSPPPPDVFPAQMEGVKLVVNKVLSSHFQVPHFFGLSLRSSLPTSLGPCLLSLLVQPWPGCVGRMRRT